MSYAVTIRRQDLSALVDMRGEAKEIAALLSGLDLALPDTPNTAAEAGGRTVYWLGPEHWLLRAPIAEEDALLAGLGKDPLPPEVSLVLVSDAYAFFEISGAEAVEVMAVASPLDLHPSVFPAKGSAFTEAFGLKALVIRHGDGFELAVDRSLGDMTEDYLARVVAF